jgi:hypothetical protein
MKRRLLPYEHELIQILGISEEDYLDFLAVQHDFSRSPEEKLQELRGDPVSITLAVVGILFQVASVLLAPKPEIPDIKNQARNRRDQQFSPRFGFNTAQELARYGDPVNLIYCNTADNANGGVRAATSLVWSAVQSGGSSQFMQMLMVIGAGPIEEVDFQKTAFGQTPVAQFATQRAWTYFSTDTPTFNNLVSGDTSDPTRTGLPSSSFCYLIRPSGDTKAEGFSQAFSPTTLNKFGLFAPIPINADYVGRSSSGSRRVRSIEISASGLETYWPLTGTSRPAIPIGSQFTVNFAQYSLGDDKFTEAAADTRIGLFSNVDAASLYKLGSAIFRIKSISAGGIEESSAAVVFECIESGVCPEIAYSIADIKQIADAPSTSRSAYLDTKCLVKYERASYSTITDCAIIEFALKARVFKRVQGRASKYGDNDVDYKDSENGVKFRVSLFWLWYKQKTSTTWTKVNTIFAVRRTADIDNFIFLRFKLPANSGGYEFRFDPIADPASEMRYHGITDYSYIENSGSYVTIANADNTSVQFLGYRLAADSTYLPPRNKTPLDLTEWSLFSLRSDTQLQLSLDQGPEITIAAVTEQRQDSFSNYPELYNNLSMMGFNAYSGQGIQDLRSVTAFVKKGKMLRRLTPSGSYPAQPDGSSSYAPDIFLDTILDTVNGIGRYARIEGIDLPALGLAKQFCVANNFYMDCVIADRAPWRQFWSEVALYSLLEFGRIGGKETLVPAIPCTAAGQITRNVSITALFNQGNIMEDSYKEEFLDYGANTQDLIATVVYRDTQADEFFPRNTSLEIRRTGVTDATAVRQTFDLSQYVTNRAQAIAFGKLVCNQRAYIRKAIEFSTFPTDSVISPGSYIYVAVGRNEWDKVSTGVVEAGGVLNTPLNSAVAGGSYSALLYRSSAPVVNLSGVSVSNNASAQLAAYEGYVFVLGTPISRRRVFRVSEVQMDEDGQINVKAVEHPCVDSGAQTLSLIADFSDNLFVVR